MTDEKLSFVSYNDIGEGRSYNQNHTAHGELHIDKSGEEIRITSSGSLEVIDQSQPVVHIDFEERVPLSSRPVLGLRHTSWKTKRVGRKIIIRNRDCQHSIPNKESFGRKWQYLLCFK